MRRQLMKDLVRACGIRAPVDRARQTADDLQVESSADDNAVWSLARQALPAPAIPGQKRVQGNVDSPPPGPCPVSWPGDIVRRSPRAQHESTTRPRQVQQQMQQQDQNPIRAMRRMRRM